MHKLLYLISAFIFLSVQISFAQADSTATKKSSQAREIYIPKNLNESFEQLNKLLRKKDIASIKSVESEDGLAKYHIGLGRWIRNNWGLWSGSRLSKYFNKLGIHHPDDMSSIILESYWRNLNGKPLHLEEQVKYYKKYWDKVNKDSTAKELPLPDSSNSNYH
jgi:hypothetical protein